MIRFGTRFLSRIPTLVAAAALAAAAATVRADSLADRMQRDVETGISALQTMRDACDELRFDTEVLRNQIEALKARCNAMKQSSDAFRNGPANRPNATVADLDAALDDVLRAIRDAEDGFSAETPAISDNFDEGDSRFQSAESDWDSARDEARKGRRTNPEAAEAWNIFYGDASVRIFEGDAGLAADAAALRQNVRGLQREFSDAQGDHSSLLGRYKELLQNLNFIENTLRAQIEARRPQPLTTNLPPQTIKLKFVVRRGATDPDGNPYGTEIVKELENADEPFSISDPSLRFHKFMGWRDTQDSDRPLVESFEQWTQGSVPGRFFEAVFEEIPAKVVYFDANGGSVEWDNVLRTAGPTMQNPRSMYRGNPSLLEPWGSDLVGWIVADAIPRSGKPGDAVGKEVGVPWPDDIPVESEVTWIVPRYEPTRFPVSFAGGRVESLTLSDRLPVVATPARPHYEGIGWMADPDGGRVDFSVSDPPDLAALLHEPATNLVLHPVYRPVEYMVSFRSRTADDASDAAWATNLSATVETRFAGVPVPEPNLEPQYRFLGWFAEGAAAPAVFDAGTRITGNVTLTARFEPIEYTATFEGVGTFRFSVQKPLAKPAEVPAEPEGMTFDGWSLSGTGAPFTFTQESSLGLLGNDVSFAPLWKKREYEVRFTVGRSTVEMFHVPHGERLRGLPDEPHHRALQFEGWARSMPFGKEGFYDFSLPVTNDVALTAVFASAPTISAHPPEPSEKGVNNRLDSLVQWLSAHGVTTRVAWIVDGALLLLLLFLLLLLRRR